MPITRISITNAMTFDQVTTRLSQQRAVDGLIVVGSASADQMTPASDYDLVLVLSEMPVPLHTGVTHIDGRFTDLVFHTSMQIEQILDATKPFWFLGLDGPVGRLADEWQGGI
ncbi:MAG: nucleotidyltransferase domain-containing protein [Caldilineaceae bacterium]